jgi:hypothetical protein
VFGWNTELLRPDAFIRSPLAEVLEAPQQTIGLTPCAFFGSEVALAAGECVTLREVYGHIRNQDRLPSLQQQIQQTDFVEAARATAQSITQDLTHAIDTQTSSPVFDGYCRQTFLDNILRGGWPTLWKGPERTTVYPIYSRKHGDLERDYNDFFLAAEPYSQGNGNFRDVLQNRRCDVFFAPGSGDSAIRTFASLLQLDGYNPLVVKGSVFTLGVEARKALRAFMDSPEALEPLLARAFTPGECVQWIRERKVALRVPMEDFLVETLSRAEQHIQAEHAIGFWTDHWTYLLDLIESYLSIFPDRQEQLLCELELPFFDNAYVVQSRDAKYVMERGQPRQFHAVTRSEEKAAAISARTEDAQWARKENGRGEVFRQPLISKLLLLALVKMATLDPSGMGVEMEADKPGWCDAMNGLPGLFGSSMPETYEVLRLMEFLSGAVGKFPANNFSLPIEGYRLLQEVAEAIRLHRGSVDPKRDYAFWDATSAAREQYRESIARGVEGALQSITGSELAEVIKSCVMKLREGIARAEKISGAVPPTYLQHKVTEYKLLTDSTGQPRTDEAGRPCIRALAFRPEALPLFLEGPVRSFRFAAKNGRASALYRDIRASDLFDRQLGMYKVSQSLAGVSEEVGRICAFPPGWLENESIWLHMEYKYLLEVLRAGLYTDFFRDMRAMVVPFLDPAAYGRSLMENSSLIVSSAYPNAGMHGAGCVARLSGATAEWLSMWALMMAGDQPFSVQGEALQLNLKPILPGWLFSPEGTVQFCFLGGCKVTYHNPDRRDTFVPGTHIDRMTLTDHDGSQHNITGAQLGAPYATWVRDGRVKAIDAHLSFSPDPTS